MTGPKHAARVRLDAVDKRFDARQVLKNLSVCIEPGQFVSVVGRSGSGKSTLLRLLCGLEAPSAGTVAITGARGEPLHDAARVVFQEPRLLPWRCVLSNITLGKRGSDPAHAGEVLRQVGLAARADDYPAVLSGGQRQRVALARALVHEPRLLLLDEPFGALDALTRVEAQQLVERLWLETGFTTVLVTHDVGEAVLLSDRVLVIEDGQLVEDLTVDVPRPRTGSLSSPAGGASVRFDPQLAQLAERLLRRVMGSVPSADRTFDRSLEH
jgi:sulfonate transport system ATP-binding protein